MHRSDPPPDLATTQFHTDRIDGGCDECASGACLVVLQGQLLGQRLDLDEREVVLGRDSDCGFHIEERSVSRRHARIWRDAGGYRIRDLGSTNGIDYNGDRIEGKKIEEGDVFSICDYQLRFTFR